MADYQAPNMPNKRLFLMRKIVGRVDIFSKIDKRASYQAGESI